MRILVDSGSRSMAMPAAPPVAQPTRRRQCNTTTTITIPRHGGAGFYEGVGVEDDGVMVILGATGAGKSKLSIDIGTRFPAEVVNSDKMQVYHGYDITTNKMTAEERRGLPHHLLGELDPAEGELSPGRFRSLASKWLAHIRAKRRLPIVAGGSNSYVHALLAKRYDESVDPFAPQQLSGSNCTDEDEVAELNYRCCLLWVDVGWEVLEPYLDRRVEEMVEMGMVEELEANYDRSRAEERRYEGVEMAIGVPEFDKFFLRYPPRGGGGSGGGRKGEKEAYRAAVEEIKLNTRKLARRQREKIERLREMGWGIRRLDATEAVWRKVEGRGKEEVEEAWERDVVQPGLEEVGRVLGGIGYCSGGGGGLWRWRREMAVMGELVAAAR